MGSMGLIRTDALRGKERAKRERGDPISRFSGPLVNIGEGPD